jgi:hypothetical protein
MLEHRSAVNQVIEPLDNTHRPRTVMTTLDIMFTSKDIACCYISFAPSLHPPFSLTNPHPHPHPPESVRLSFDRADSSSSRLPSLNLGDRRTG